MFGNKYFVLKKGKQSALHFSKVRKEGQPKNGQMRKIILKFYLRATIQGRGNKSHQQCGKILVIFWPFLAHEFATLFTGKMLFAGNNDGGELWGKGKGKNRVKKMRGERKPRRQFPTTPICISIFVIFASLDSESGCCCVVDMVMDTNNR
jgi:hypothetical protein